MGCIRLGDGGTQAVTLKTAVDLRPIARMAGGAEQDAFRRLQALNGLLLSLPSATLALEKWCNDARPKLAGPVSVERLSCQSEPTPRALLRSGGAEPVRHRRVRLRHGRCVLSEADNWYLPGRLTREMNERLETTDVSFGRVVQALDFRRTTISAELLWHPVVPRSDGPMDGEIDADPGLSLPILVMRHRAVLSLQDGTPFSEVQERYTRAVLTFEPDSSLS